jgi:hypothetical protein
MGSNGLYSIKSWFSSISSQEWRFNKDVNGSVYVFINGYKSGKSTAIRLAKEPQKPVPIRPLRPAICCLSTPV